MSAPRQVLPGTTYLVTRRCAQRQFLLQPSPSTNAIFLYLLAVASRRFAIRIHAFCVLSNHFHLVLTDPEARLPAFGQYLDSLLARSLNATLGRWESFWAPASYSAVALLTPDDVVDKAAYVLANPVAAGLVRRARTWSGLWSPPELVEVGRLEARRPDAFFRPRGNMPEVAVLELTSPPGFGPGEYRARLEQALATREVEASIDPAPERLGPSCARPAPVTREPRRNLRPRVACRDPVLRRDALARLAAFLDDYRVALESLRSGLRATLFPRGTYWMRVYLGVTCSASP